MKIAYIAHPIGAIKPVSDRDAKEQVGINLASIAAIAREINIHEPDVVPFAPYYLDCCCMDDNNPSERQRGIDNDNALLRAGFINELRLYGERISHGMMTEIIIARECNIAILPMTIETAAQWAVINNQL